MRVPCALMLPGDHNSMDCRSFNPNNQRQNKATDFDLLHAKTPSNFPLQCHHVGNIGFKTPSFLLLSSHVWPKVWMKPVRDASTYCTKEREGVREREKAILTYLLQSCTEAVKHSRTTMS